nr:MAG: hypothetical protein DIU58_06320 [Sphaerobacter thermophilus]
MGEPEASSVTLARTPRRRRALADRPRPRPAPNPAHPARQPRHQRPQHPPHRPRDRRLPGPRARRPPAQGVGSELMRVAYCVFRVPSSRPARNESGGSYLWPAFEGAGNFGPLSASGDAGLHV